MKLQLALDRLSKKECYQILEQTRNEIDWIEIGTGVIKEYGMSIVKEIKSDFPEKIVVADMKTCDAGTHEAIQAFEAGADVTTVMGFADNGTITDMLTIAYQYRKKVMVDLLGITSATRIKELIDLGVDFLGLHIGVDMQKSGNKANEALIQLIDSTKEIDISVAGGINEESLHFLIPYQPSVIIVGSAITKAADPLLVCQRLKGMMR